MGQRRYFYTKAQAHTPRGNANAPIWTTRTKPMQRAASGPGKRIQPLSEIELQILQVFKPNIEAHDVSAL